MGDSRGPWFESSNVLPQPPGSSAAAEGLCGVGTFRRRAVRALGLVLAVGALYRWLFQQRYLLVNPFAGIKVRATIGLRLGRVESMTRTR